MNQKIQWDKFKAALDEMIDPASQVDIPITPILWQCHLFLNSAEYCSERADVLVANMLRIVLEYKSKLSREQVVSIEHCIDLLESEGVEGEGDYDDVDQILYQIIESRVYSLMSHQALTWRYEDEK